MKIPVFTITLLFLSLSLSAQQKLNRVGVGLDYLSLDQPDDLVFSPHINFERKLPKRFYVSGKLGFVNLNDTDTFYQNIPEQRQRVNLDFKASFAVLKYKNNYLKIGIGPSFWYRKENIVTQISFGSDYPDQVIDYKKRYTNELNAGFNVGVELDIYLSKSFSVLGNLGVANLNKAGISSQLGLGFLYNFSKN